MERRRNSAELTVYSTFFLRCIVPRWPSRPLFRPGFVKDASSPRLDIFWRRQAGQVGKRDGPEHLHDSAATAFLHTLPAGTREALNGLPPAEGRVEFRGLCGPAVVQAAPSYDPFPRLLLMIDDFLRVPRPRSGRGRFSAVKPELSVLNSGIPVCLCLPGLRPIACGLQSMQKISAGFLVFGQHTGRDKRL